MTPDRWREIERLCQAALERPESERAAFLDAGCAGAAAVQGAFGTRRRRGRRGDPYKLGCSTAIVEETEARIGY